MDTSEVTSQYVICPANCHIACTGSLVFRGTGSYFVLSSINTTYIRERLKNTGLIVAIHSWM